MTESTADALLNPIINSPYEPPAAHFEIGPKGPTGEKSRAATERVIHPVPARKEASGREAERAAGALDFDHRRAARGQHADQRHPPRGRAVAHPRQRRRDALHPQACCTGPRPGEPGAVLPAGGGRDRDLPRRGRGPHGNPDYRAARRANALHNDGLPRIALKMATGTGKTVVMAMLIAWQTVNKARAARRPLRQAVPRRRPRHHDPGPPRRAPPGARRATTTTSATSCPPDLWGALLAGADRDHQLPRVPPARRQGDQGRPATPASCSSPGRMATPSGRPRQRSSPRAARLRAARGDRRAQRRGPPLLPGPAARRSGEDAERGRGAQRDARVWFSGLQAIARKVGVKAIYDLSATPFYLGGSGYNEGYIFPWVVSDFSLMDAIESGIVKVPRIPVDDDATGDVVTYLRLWDHVGSRSRSGRPRTAPTTTGCRPRSSRGRCAASTAATSANHDTRSRACAASASHRRC